MTTTQQKFITGEKEIAESLIGRWTEVRIACAGLLTGSNVSFIGEAGLAKTLVCERMATFVQGKQFKILMHKGLEPSHVFGPVSCKKLFDEDEVEHKVDGYLPTAEVAILDEIFNASPAINNSLLTLLNERKFVAGKQQIKSSLRTVYCASNRYPGDDDGLAAMWDRFLLRRWVEPIKDTHQLHQMTWHQETLQYQPTVQVTMEDLDTAQAEVAAIPFSPEAISVFEELLNTCEHEGLHVTNRRRCALPLLCKANAYLNGNDVVTPEDLEILEHAIWEDHEDRAQATRLVAKFTSGPGSHVRDKLVSARDVYSNADKGEEPLSSALEKLTYLASEVKDINAPKTEEAYLEIKGLMKKLNNKLLESV